MSAANYVLAIGGIVIFIGTVGQAIIGFGEDRRHIRAWADRDERARTQKDIAVLGRWPWKERVLAKYNYRKANPIARASWLRTVLWVALSLGTVLVAIGSLVALGDWVVAVVWVLFAAVAVVGIWKYVDPAAVDSGDDTDEATRVRE
ncbi:hypothetical protein [Gordonia iterans]